MCTVYWSVTRMKLISFKADRLLLCVFFSQLWVSLFFFYFNFQITLTEINKQTKQKKTPTEETFNFNHNEGLERDHLKLRLRRGKPLLLKRGSNWNDSAKLEDILRLWNKSCIYLSSHPPWDIHKRGNKQSWFKSHLFLICNAFLWSISYWN